MTAETTIECEWSVLTQHPGEAYETITIDHLIADHSRSDGRRAFRQRRLAHSYPKRNAGAVALQPQALYDPGVMMCAAVVPAPMIQAPPILLLSGMPSDAAVAFGTAIVTCRRTVVTSLPCRV